MASEFLAKSIRANPVLIRTLIMKLSKNKLVVTVRGKTGGARLGKSPRSISLLDIYRSLAPAPLICTRETKGDKNCPVGRCMDGIVQKISGQIENQIEMYLKNRTLAEVIAEVSE